MVKEYEPRVNRKRPGGGGKGVRLLFLIIVVGVVVFSYLRIKGLIDKREAPPGELLPPVERLLQKMTLEEKVGQVLIAYFTGPEFTSSLAVELEEIPLGGIILYEDRGNIESPAQVAALIEKIQKTALDKEQLPLFIALDQEGGSVARLTAGVTIFPGNMALGATGSTELAALNASIIARELRILGINLNFAPVVDVNNNPANPVIGVRSFGSSPEAVSHLGRAMVAPYFQEGVLATAKHFPGHGDTDVDSHYGLPLIPYDLSRLKSLELLPFEAMVEAGVPVVMMAHLLAPGLTGSDELPTSLSPSAVRYLREEIGFDGLITTDSISMGAITDHLELEEAAVKAFQAGVDIILFGPWTGFQPGDRQEIFRSLLGAVKDGTITVERLDQSVRRIITAKIEHKIIDDPLPRLENLPALASPPHREVARRIARESITLVRDRAVLIPLPSRETVPLIWPAELESALVPLVEESPYLQPHLLSLQASPAAIDELEGALGDAPLVLVATYNLSNCPAWVNLFNNRVMEQEAALIALSSPYDLLLAPRVGTCLCTYSTNSDSMQALGQVLNGTLIPHGRLPVELY